MKCFLTGLFLLLALHAFSQSDMDTVRVNLTLFERKNASTFSKYTGLTDQDTVVYEFFNKSTPSTVTMVKVDLDEVNSTGRFRKGGIKEVTLSFFNDQGQILAEEKSTMRPTSGELILWNGMNSLPEPVPGVSLLTIDLLVATKSGTEEVRLHVRDR